MFNLDGDMVSGLFTIIALLIMAALAIIANRRGRAETITETINTEY